jgi:hypothetical protein
MERWQFDVTGAKASVEEDIRAEAAARTATQEHVILMVAYCRFEGQGRALGLGASCWDRLRENYVPLGPTTSSKSGH